MHEYAINCAAVIKKETVARCMTPPLLAHMCAEEVWLLGPWKPVPP